MREEKIINPEIQDNAEENLEKTLRPQLLNEYIGQTKIKESMEIFIGAAKKRKEALDHVLLYGPPGLGSKFIHQGEKNAAKYADEVIVLSKGVQDYFKETYGRETHFIPNGVNRPQIREASLITDKFGLKKDSYILFLGRLVPEKGIRYLVEAFKNVKTDKKLVIAGGSSDTDSFMEELKDLAKGDDRILFTGFVQGAMLDELYSNAYIYTLPSDLEGMPLIICCPWHAPC